MINNLIGLWTIQPVIQWENLVRNGVMRSDGRHAFRPYRSAYRWMRQQMKEKIRSYRGPSLLWAWHSPKPDLRRRAHLWVGKLGVRIEFEVPRDQILLSDFESWHHVLNGWYLAWSEKEFDDWYKSLPKKISDKHVCLIKESWQRIFDLEALAKCDQDWLGPPDGIQATLEEIRLEQVVRVEHFTAR